MLLIIDPVSSGSVDSRFGSAYTSGVLALGKRVCDEIWIVLDPGYNLVREELRSLIILGLVRK